MKVRVTRSGLHFFDRRTGLNILLDEVNAPPASWASAPRYVSIALTNACDLNCPYCYAPKSTAFLTYEQVIAWAHELDQLGCLAIGFGGGEPTLVPKFPRLCRELAQTTRLAVQFTTHGHRLTPQICEQITGCVHFIRVSMDGVGATYEKYRAKSFSVLLQQLALIRTTAPFGINCVVNSETLPELDRVLSCALNHGAQELLLLPEIPANGRPGIDRESARKLVAWMTRNAGLLRLTTSQYGSTDGIPVACPFDKDDDVDSYAHIDATGILKRSSFAASGVSIGTESIQIAVARLRENES